MRLANELEHELDLGNLYCNKSETEQERHQRYMKCYGPKLVSMAKRLGALPLATEIATASRTSPRRDFLLFLALGPNIGVPMSLRQRRTVSGCGLRFGRKLVIVSQSVSESHRECAIKSHACNIFSEQRSTALAKHSFGTCWTGVFTRVLRQTSSCLTSFVETLIPTGI